ncbi:MAG: DUF3857 domain-containing protein [Candidatus Zapsychrus exili]|nr:DUF3857 domain-containing protein [Candidatus Zapsychrus exili]
MKNVFKVILLVVLLLCFAFVVYFEGNPLKPGAVLKVEDASVTGKDDTYVETQQEIEKVQEPLSFEEEHSDEDKIVLVDNYSVVLNEDWSYIRSSYKKIKILKESAKSMGEISVYYTDGRDKILALGAHTITPKGKVIKHSKIQDFKAYPSYAMYSDLRVKVLSMPEVNVGSTIEIKKIIKSKGKTIPESFWSETYLEYGYPTKESNVSYTFSKSLNINYKSFKLDDDRMPVITEDEDTITYSWHIEEAYYEGKNEDLMPTPRFEDIKNCIAFSSFNSWDDVAAWFYRVSQEGIVITPEIRQVAEKIFEGKETLKDKVRAALEYVQENFRYVSMSLGENNFKPHATDEVFANKYGDCKDLSLLTKTILSIGGINADMALFRDEDSISDPVYDLPYPILFNHVVLLVNNPKGEDFYIDPLLDDYDIGEYPMSYQMAYTFIVKEDAGVFGRFPLFDIKRDYEHSDRDIYVNIDGDGFDIRESRNVWDLNDSIRFRREYKDCSEQKKKELMEYIYSTIAPNGEILEHKIENLDEKYGIIKIKSRIKQETRYPVISDMIFINFDGADRVSVFIEKERKYPIFYPMNSFDKEVIAYHIPAGFRIEYLPPNVNLDNGFFSLKRIFDVKGEKIVYTEEVTFRRVEIPKEEYQRINKFYDELPKKINQMIILKRKKSIWEEIKDITRRWRK